MDCSARCNGSREDDLPCLGTLADRPSYNEENVLRDDSNVLLKQGALKDSQTILNSSTYETSSDESREIPIQNFRIKDDNNLEGNKNETQNKAYISLLINGEFKNNSMNKPLLEHDLRINPPEEDEYIEKCQFCGLSNMVIPESLMPDVMETYSPLNVTLKPVAPMEELSNTNQSQETVLKGSTNLNETIFLSCEIQDSTSQKNGKIPNDVKASETSIFKSITIENESSIQFNKSGGSLFESDISSMDVTTTYIRPENVSLNAETGDLKLVHADVVVIPQELKYLMSEED